MGLLACLFGCARLSVRAFYNLARAAFFVHAIVCCFV